MWQWAASVHREVPGKQVGHSLHLLKGRLTPSSQNSKDSWKATGRLRSPGRPCLVTPTLISSPYQRYRNHNTMRLRYSTTILRSRHWVSMEPNSWIPQPLFWLAWWVTLDAFLNSFLLQLPCLFLLRFYKWICLLHFEWCWANDAYCTMSVITVTGSSYKEKRMFWKRSTLFWIIRKSHKHSYDTVLTILILSHYHHKLTDVLHTFCFFTWKYWSNIKSPLNLYVCIHMRVKYFCYFPSKSEKKFIFTRLGTVQLVRCWLPKYQELNLDPS